MSQQINLNGPSGRHDVLSPVIGTRANELIQVQQELQTVPVLSAFEDALHGEADCSVSHLYVIPREKQKEAESIAQKLFSNYLTKYGISVEDAIDWVPAELWGIRFQNNESPGIAILKPRDPRAGVLSLHVHAAVNKNGGQQEKGYLPASLIAYHEFQHVEEISLREGKERGFGKKGSELLPSLQTLIFVDLVYKEVFGKHEEEIIDFSETLKIGRTSLSTGKVANFYRALARSEGSLCKAVLSEASLRFLTGE